MLILTTGGAGFIGSHTNLELLNAGHSVISLDNGSNAYVDGFGVLPESLRRVQELTGKTVINYAVDIRDKNALDGVFKKVSHLFIFITRSGYTVGGVGKCVPVALKPFSSAM